MIKRNEIFGLNKPFGKQTFKKMIISASLLYSYAFFNHVKSKLIL